MKKILLSLICLISAIAINAETTVSITFKDQGYANAQEIKSVTLDDNIKVTFDKGSNSNNSKYYNTGTAIRVYGGNKVTIAGVDNGVTISKVYFKVGSSNKLNSESTVTAGTLNNKTDVKPFISDINSNTVTLTQGGTSGHARIESMEVVYEVSAATQVATPAITPNGGEVSATDPISISCATEGASIYYTIDGSVPTTENGTLYAAPFTLVEAATVKAIAVAEGLDNSGVAEATFTFPAANINEFITNNYKHASTISGAVTVVAQLGSYLFLQDETAKIIAFGSLNKSYDNGDQLTGVKGTYNLYNGLPEMNVEAASFGTATAGTPVEPTTITLAELKSTPLLTYIKVEGVKVPTGSGKSFTITDASGSATMYNTAGAEIVSGENMIVEGFVSCYNTTIQLLPIKITTQSGKEVVAAPVIAPNGGAISVDAEITISCETEGASIYYTIDGTEPSAENGTLYEAPFTLAEDATVKAIAVAEGMENSSVTEAAFTLLSATVSNVTFDFTKPSSLNPVQDEPALGQKKEVSVNKTVFTAGNVSLSFNKGTAGTDCRIWAGTSAYDLRTYKGSSFTISATGADITNIVFTGGKASKSQMTANVGEFVGSTWTGSAQSVVFTATGTTNINTITVTYDTATAIEEIEAENAPVEYYNLQGVKVANPENGIFIKKQGAKTTKVVL